jgi:ADP-heptose:LPS heptosyltransferase
MTVPIVWAVAQKYPDVRITVLSRSFARPFFENLAPNVNFMEADLKGEYHGVKGLNKLYRRLAAKQFTHVADLHSVLRSNYLRLRFNLGHFKVAHIDKHRKMRHALVNKNMKKKVKQQLPTSFENYTEVFAKLGFPIDDNQFTSIFPPEDGDLTLLPELFREKKEDQPWIGIAPFAAHQGKIYPKEQMREVIRQLIKDYPDARIMLFGRGKDEDATFPQWIEEMPQCTIVSQHISAMQQELILMSHLDVMVSMDSANMHLASLVNTPVVSVWGATHPMAGFLGWHQKKENAIQLDMECRPCSIYGQKPCIHGDFRCMTGIKPEMIVERIKNIINP